MFIRAIHPSTLKYLRFSSHFRWNLFDITRLVVSIYQYMVNLYQQVVIIYSTNNNRLIMFILKGLLRAESQERILLYLTVRETGYGSAIAKFYGTSQNSIQKQLAHLEEDSVIVSRLIGKVREYQLNPRYRFYTPLKSLLKLALEAYPESIIQDLVINRTRPRKAGKTLVPSKP